MGSLGRIAACATLVVAVGLATSCAVEDGSDDLETIVIQQPAVALAPEWATQHTETMDPRTSPPPGPTDPLDPCSCTTDECLDDWVEETVGCGVCIVVFCGGEPHVHHCSFCVER